MREGLHDGRLVGPSTRVPRRAAGSQRDGEARGERGLSLIEVVVVLGLMVVVAAIIYQLILATVRASMFAEGRNDIATIGQRVVNTIHGEVLQSKLVFQEDTIGSGYRTRFVNALPAGISVWTNSRMPIIDGNTTTIGPDPGSNGITNRTGNSLIVAVQLSPISIPWDHDNNTSTPNIDFMADRYRLEYYFLRQNVSHGFASFGYYLEVMQARTQVVADYFQISSLPVNQGQVVTALRAQTPSVHMAWDPGKRIAAPAFYNLRSDGNVVGNLSPTFIVTVSSLLPELAGGRISGKMLYSVGMNAGTPLVVRDPIPLYATPTGNFPGGLEFQIVGPSGSRKLLTRIVLVSESLGEFVSRESEVITSARGF